MTPHYAFWECTDCEEDFVKMNCFSQGKYCAHDTNHEKLSGRLIMFEDLRQKCLFNIYFKKMNKKKIWWDYMAAVHKECYGSVNIDCSKFAHKEAGIDFEKTQECVMDSFTMTSEASDLYQSKNLRNTILDKEMEYGKKWGPTTFPGIVINNSTFRGQLETEHVFNAICAGFQDLPKECYKLYNKDELK